MGLTKLVNGKRIELSADEEAAVKAEWAKADEEAAAEAAKDPADELVKRDPFKQVVEKLLCDATGKKRKDIIDLIKSEMKSKDS